MWSDRVERIATCMEDFAWCRAQRSTPEGKTMINQVGELDQLSELHRLIWEEE